MDTVDKIYFAFSAYDFDNAGSLSFDEATLLLRSVVQGLGKVSPANLIFTSPKGAEIEKFASLVFLHCNKDAASRSDSRVTTAEFRSYCSVHPVTSSWLKAIAQFPAEADPTPDTTSGTVVDVSILLGASANQTVVAARQPQQSASIISEEDYQVIVDAKAAEAFEEARPKAIDLLGNGGDDGGDEEDDEVMAAKAAAAAAALAALAKADPDAPAPPVWAAAVDLMRPEEVPAEMRTDPPEDLFEPIWLTGVNTCRVGANALATPLIHRCVKYGNMTLPPVPEAVADGEEVAPVVIPTTLVGSAARQLVFMKKDEETGWSQKLFFHHASSISCLDVQYSKNILVTADDCTNQGTASRIVIWDLTNFSIVRTISTVQGVKLVDISENGLHLLAVSTDLASTVTMYEIATGKVVYARPLLLGPRIVKDCITDVRFTGTSSMFAVSSAVQGVTFYVEEGGSFMGPDGLKLYEERSGKLFLLFYFLSFLTYILF